MPEARAAHQDHFADLETQAHAARLGIWVFLASELLLFAGFFALYGSYRTRYPVAFGLGVLHSERIIGTINTVILLCSSYTVALAVHSLRQGRRRASASLLGVTVALGCAFLALKGYEYSIHFREGIYPGGRSAFFEHDNVQGLGLFYTLYFAMTGLHALHVAVGMGVLTVILVRVARGTIAYPAGHAIEIAAVYWHLIDVIWIFLWPLFYLTPGGAS